MGRGCVKCDIPDVAFVTLRFPCGAVAEVQLSWLSPVKLRRTLVVGSKKMLVYDDTESVEKVKLYDHGVNIVNPVRSASSRCRTAPATSSRRTRRM